MPDLKINKLEDTTNWNYLKHKEKKNPKPWKCFTKACVNDDNFKQTHIWYV